MATRPAPLLYVFSGLPGTGKSTLARRLAAEVQAAYLRIDTIEQALRDLCGVPVVDQGYRLAYRLAGDSLAAGTPVVADSCNPIGLTRADWAAVARERGCAHVDIEVLCSDPGEHRHRVEHRPAEVPGLVLPGWEQVRTRDYQPWTGPRIRLDTAGRTPAQSFAELLALLAAGPGC